MHTPIYDEQNNLFYKFKLWDNGLFIALVPKVLQYRFLLETFNEFYGLAFKLSVQTFQPLQKGNFVRHHWKCTSIYRPLSYPFRSL